MSINYRLYRPSDLEPTLALVNQIFQVENPKIPLAAWEKLEAGDHVTVLAEDAGRIVGAIPYDLRTFALRPGHSIRAAFAHCVGVAADYRAAGVGSGMMAHAKQALKPYCDGLFVYTSGEGHAPYTFYQRNGFVDLHYSRTYTLTEFTGEGDPAIEITPLNPATLDGAALYAIYREAYPVQGGFPVREPSYWQRAFASIIYVQIPCAFYLARAHVDGQLAGYGLFAYNARGAHMPRGVYILELAAPARYPGLAERLLRAIIAAAPSLGAQAVSMQASGAHPALPDLLKLGFQAAPRAQATVVAGQLLDLEKAWAALADGREAPALHLWTPQRQLDLPGSGPAITLEMKEETLQRLFLCREDPATALRDERITSPAGLLPVPALQALFQPAPWVHHGLDWI